MTDRRTSFRQAIRPLLEAALHADNLRDWSGGVLTASGRRLDDRLKDDALRVLERYLLAHGGLLEHELDGDLLAAFGDEIDRLCHDETVSLRTSYSAVGWLLEGWRFLADLTLPDDEPHIVLPACAAVATGIHAAAFQAVEQGARTLMHLAASPLWPVRDAVPRGLCRMLDENWPRTCYELRRYAHIGGALQHRAIALALVTAPSLTKRAHALDALDLLHTILAAYRRLSRGQRLAESAQALHEALVQAVGAAITAERCAGFAAAQTWLAWHDPGITAIVQAAIAQPPLAACEEAALLRRSSGNGMGTA